MEKRYKFLTKQFVFGIVVCIMLVRLTIISVKDIFFFVTNAFLRLIP